MLEDEECDKSEGEEEVQSDIEEVEGLFGKESNSVLEHDALEFDLVGIDTSHDDQNDQK